jgi:hypothetical protein
MIETSQKKLLIATCLSVCALAIIGCASEPIATVNHTSPPPVAVTPPPAPPVARACAAAAHPGAVRCRR